MSDENEPRPGEAPLPDDQSVPEQSEPMSLLDDMGEPMYDVVGVALGAVSPQEAADVRAAASADSALAAELAAMREVVAELSRIEAVEMINRGRSAGIRSRLLARATASRAGRPAGRQGSAGTSGIASGANSANSGDVGNNTVAGRATPVSGSRGRTTPLSVSGAGANGPRSSAGATQPGTRADVKPESRHDTWHELSVGVGGARRRPSRAMGWLALAASIAFAAALTQLWRVSRDKHEVVSAVASQQSTLIAKLNQLQDSIVARDRVIAALTGPTTRVIDLASYSSLNPAARMFWDQKTQQWTMYASQLRPPRPGKTYQLWLIASGHPAPISAGTFAPDAGGHAVMQAKYNLQPGTLKRVAVTEEPAGGVPAPTGPVIFAGTGVGK